MKYKLIIFDLDGTLIDSHSIHVSAFDSMMKEHRIKYSKRYLRKMFGIPTKEILKKLKKKYKFKENVEDLLEEKEFLYFKKLGNKNLVFKGVEKTLKNLKKKYKIALATDSKRIIFIHSTKKSFQKLFDFVVSINDVKKGKPSPEMLLLIAKSLKISNKECLFVGDSIYDAIAAKKSKMDFVGVKTGESSEKE